MQHVVLGLAPMQGFTDFGVRELLTSLGGVDFCVTEFIRVTQQPLPAHMIVRQCPELTQGGATRSGVPVHVQLLGAVPEAMAVTAARAAALGAPVIDLNFGCPVKRVNRHDGGAALLRTPKRIEQITAAVRAAVPSPVPISAKLRLGWSDAEQAVEIARAAEQGGASWITVHGRTREQLYGGCADWESIGRVREGIGIPVIANGDVSSPATLDGCRRATGCISFMIGRGARATPEVFRVLRGLEAFWPAWKRVALIEQFCRWEVVRRGGGATPGRIVGWCAAMRASDVVMKGVFEHVKCAGSLADAADILREASERLRLQRRNMVEAC